MHETIARFGRTIRSHRTSQNLSQAYLAECCNLDRSFVSDIERGVKEPRLGTICKLADGLGLRPYDLLRDA